MAGFDKIKRTLERYNPRKQKFEIMFEDKNPIKVEYMKCYEDEEIYGYNFQRFCALTKKLQINKPGYYRFTVDTLGSYIETRCEYKIEYKPTMSLVKKEFI